MQAIEPNELLRHLRYLTETIGVRLAGSANEAKAGEYVAAEFERAGATVRRETFPVQRRDVREQQLQLFHDGAWHDYPCSLFANTPGTNGEWVEAPLVFFEGPTGYQQSDLGALMCGRIVLHLGCHIESRENYRRLVAAGPMGVLMVDLRYPGATPLADAIFPAYVASCGAVPSLNVAYLDAWAWRERGATRARFRVVGGPQPAESQNIVAELPGTDPAAAGLVAPVVSAAASLPRAGFWIRIAALLLDVILLGILFGILHASGKLFLVTMAAYGACMWRLRGTTIGGIVCGLKVVRLDDREVDWATAIVRALGCFLSLVVLGLGFIWVAFDDGKQSWHDKIAGTTVVQVPKGVSLL